jgi:hypothetical protein
MTKVYWGRVGLRKSKKLVADRPQAKAPGLAAPQKRALGWVSRLGGLRAAPRASKAASGRVSKRQSERAPREDGPPIGLADFH